MILRLAGQCDGVGRQNLEYQQVMAITVTKPRFRFDIAALVGSSGFQEVHNIVSCVFPLWIKMR